MQATRLTLAAALLLGTFGSALANVTYTLSSVTLSSTAGGAGGLGSLTGTFTTNDARTSVISFDLTASAAGSFTGFEYTNANSTVSASSLPGQYFQLDSANNIDELRVYFASALTATGTTIASASSYEHEPSGGNRFPSGSITVSQSQTAAPEPASLALLAAGLVGTVLVRKRRNA